MASLREAIATLKGGALTDAYQSSLPRLRIVSNNSPYLYGEALAIKSKYVAEVLAIRSELRSSWPIYDGAEMPEGPCSVLWTRPPNSYDHWLA